MIVLSPEGTIRKVNPATQNLLGYDPHELTNRPFSRILPESPLDQIVQNSRFREDGIRSLECRFLAKGGNWIPAVVSVSPLRGKNGEGWGFVCIAHDLSERNLAEEEIRRLAYHDPLTALPNRALFHDRLNQAIAQADREEQKFALFFIDLDRFKEVNDTFGHDGGDSLLKQVSQRIQRRIRKSDTLARLGGDEFVLISALHTEENAVEIAQGLLDLLTHPFEVEGKEVLTSASIGIVLYPEDGSSSEELLKHADMAMYVAKAKGRGVFEFFSTEINILSYERRNLEISLRRALDEGGFSLQYQPQFDLKTGKVNGVEALLRWNDPVHGEIPPRKFLPVAEQTGLIRQLGHWVLLHACREYREWQRIGLPTFRLSINVSGAQFMHPDFVEVIDRVLEETGIDPRVLELELNESTLMGNISSLIGPLLDLKVRGIHLAIDDFGTGYSSLSYLKYFPISRLKIDQSFIRDVDRDKDNGAIVEAIIAMAQSLGLRVTAEGVEKRGELAFVKQRGANDVQGCHCAPPLSAGELVNYFRRGAAIGGRDEKECLRGAAPVRQLLFAETKLVGTPTGCPGA